MTVNQLSNKIKAFENKPVESFILRFCASWVLTAIACLVLFNGAIASVAATGDVSFTKIICIFVVFFGVLSIAVLLSGKAAIDRWVLFFSLFPYTVVAASMAENYYFNFGVTAVWALLLYYYCSKGYLTFGRTPGKKTAVILIGGLAVLFFAVTGATGVLRYLSYNTPNYDFGIFCHVFRNLKEHFTPVSTCERDVLLSHFRVHVSPIFYVLLPVYYIFPSPVTLQLSQALLLTSAVVPFALLCKQYRLSNLKTVVFSAVFLLFPAVSSGMNYDFHENCFLLPLLFWVFYFFEKQKYIPLGIFTLLTLMVKEDAAVYIIFFALFVIFSRRRYVTGAVLFAGAGIYFGIALLFLSKYGDGIMSTRYANYITNDGGLLEAVKNVIANPAYVFTQLFINRKWETGDKVLYILQMTVPLAFIPFTGKKVSRLILLLPMLLLNLMTTYPYQYDIGFQYSFATTAFLFYLSIINISELKPQTAKMLVSTAAMAGLMCFAGFTVPRLADYVERYADNIETIEAVNAFLEEIPDDKSIVASTYLVPHLIDREEIYEVEYHDNEKSGYCDLVLFDMRGNYAELIEQYEEAGYHQTDSLTVNGEEIIVVMSR